MEPNQLLSVFFTGLLTGGLTCMAVQGGLLASTIVQRTQEKLLNKTKSSGYALPIISFLVAKIIAYTILGFILGYVGSFFQLSIQTRILLQVAVVVFMLGTAFNLLNIHPLFRYFVIQPPRFLTRFIRKESKSSSLFAPALLGFFTVFIPCGTTQAMMALSIVSGSALSGALILFAFTLGTSPVFFLLGYFATRLGDVFQQRFGKIAAYVIILLALFNLNNTLALSGFPITLESFSRTVACTLTFCSQAVEGSTAVVNRVTIEFTDSGYTPSSFVVKKGSTVTLDLVNDSGYGCVQSFTIPSLNVQSIVPIGKRDEIVFTVPGNVDEIPFMCGMGMYRGKIRVI